MSGSGDSLPLVPLVPALPESLPTIDDLIRAKLEENRHKTHQTRELPNIVALCLLGIVIGIASNIISAVVA